MSVKKLILLGAGGHCSSVLDSMDRTLYADIAIIDAPKKVGQTVHGITVAGTDEELPDFYAKGYRQAFITLGSIGHPQRRINLYSKLKKIGFSLPAVIDQSSIISDCRTHIAEGVFIGKGAIINTGVQLGFCCIINSGVIIDHDCSIGAFCHLGPGASLSGDIKIGENSHIGTGSSIIQRVCIGHDTVIGAGSVVVDDIMANAVAFGNPCRVVCKNEVV